MRLKKRRKRTGVSQTPEIDENRRKNEESGELYSPEKEERRVSRLNPDVMDEEDERWFNPPNDAWLI